MIFDRKISELGMNVYHDGELVAVFAFTELGMAAYSTWFASLAVGTELTTEGTGGIVKAAPLAATAPVATHHYIVESTMGDVYTGKAGKAWLASDPTAAFQYATQIRAMRVADRFNANQDLHGHTFFVTMK